MKGQWIGRYSDTNKGLAVIDIDDEDTHYCEHAFVFDDDNNIPAIVGEIINVDKSPAQVIHVNDLEFIRPYNSILINKRDIKKDFPGLLMPSCISLPLEEKNSSLTAEWSTDVGTSGSAIFAESACGHISSLIPLKEVLSWRSFREYALSLPHRDFIFRGQDVCKRLRTSFHRSRRKDLIRYISRDIPEAHRALTSRTKHLFDLHEGTQNAAFLKLLQHHGHPTPLLD